MRIQSDLSIRQEIFKRVQNLGTNLNHRAFYFRRFSKPKTKGNYDLLSITIQNEFLQIVIRQSS